MRLMVRIPYVIGIQKSIAPQDLISCNLDFVWKQLFNVDSFIYIEYCVTGICTVSEPRFSWELQIDGLCLVEFM